MKRPVSKLLLVLACALPLPATQLCRAADLTGAAPSAQGARDYAQVLPENAAAVIAIDNWFNITNPNLQTFASRLFNSPAMQGFLQTQFSGGKFPSLKEISEDLNLEAKDLPRLFTGKMAVALMLTAEPANQADQAQTQANKPEGAGDAQSGEDGQDGNRKSVIQVTSSVNLKPVALFEFKGSPAELDRLAENLKTSLKRKFPDVNLLRDQTAGNMTYTFEYTPKDEDGKEGEQDGKTESKEPGHVHFTLTDGVLVVSSDKNLLIDTQRALGRGVGAHPLSGNPDFIAVKKEMGANDGYFMLNLGGAARENRENMIDALKKSVAENPSMAILLDPLTVMNALALENFGMLYGSANLDQDALALRLGLTWKEQTGLPSLFKFGKDPVRVPAFATQDYKSVSAASLDLPGVWDAACALIQKASPGGWGLMTMAANGDPKMAKLLPALKKGLRDNLEPGYCDLTGYASATPTDNEQPGDLLVLQVKDPVAAEAALVAMVNMKKTETPAKERDYLGVKIHEFPQLPIGAGIQTAQDDGDGDEDGNDGDGNTDAAKEKAVAQEPLRFACAIVDHHVVLSMGPKGLMEGAIANIKNPGHPLITNQGDALLGTLPGTECAVTYRDGATFLKRALNEALRAGEKRLSKEEKSELLKARDACKDIHCAAVSKTYFDGKGVYMRMIIADEKTLAK